MIQKTTIAALLVIFSLIFAAVTTNATPILNRSPGQVVFCDFYSTVTDRITFTELVDKITRMLEQLNSGFERTSKFEYQLGSESPRKLIDPDLIYPPGLKPFQVDFENTDINRFVDVKIRIFRDDEEIALCVGKLVGGFSPYNIYLQS